MKAISIKQPWAYLICSGIKDVENRNWKCPQKYIGQRILIHASAKPTVKGNCISCWMTEDQYKFITLNISSGKRLNDICFLEHYSSAIIGSVKIVDCVVNHPSVWAEKGVFNWVLSEPILFDTPISAKGRLGFWEYKETISMGYHGLKEGMIVDFLLGDEWKIGYGTILYFDDNSGLPVVEMNYPGHDGCRWAHEYSLDSIRPSAL